MSLVGRTWSSTSQFSPNDIPRLVLWLDAADSNSFVFTTGSNVFRWLDKSGFSNHADVSYFPGQIGGPLVRTPNAINGLPAVSFSNSNSAVGFLAFDNAVMTGFAVVKPQLSAVGRTAQRIVSATLGTNSDINATSRFAVMVSSNVNTLEFNRGQTYANVPRFDISADISLGNAFLVSWYGDGATSTLRKNGSLNGVTNSNIATGGGLSIQNYALGREYVGGASNYVGQIAEVLLYSSPVVSPYREMVEEYLATKWGLSSSLPSNNAFAVAGRSIPQRDFRPEDVSGLQIWIDAQDVSSFDLSGNTSIVLRVRDKSSNRYPLGNAGFGAQTYTWTSNQFNTSYPSFRTTGGLGNQLASNRTIFERQVSIYFAGQATTFGTGNWLLDGCAGSTAAKITISNGAIGTAVGTVSNLTQASNPHVFSYVGGLGAGTMYLNAQAYGGGGTNNTFQGLTLGNSSNGSTPYIGHICEFLVYSGAHSYDKRDRIESYLAQKWGMRSVATGLSSIGFASATVNATQAVHPYRYVPSPITNGSDLSGLRMWIDASDPSYSRTDANGTVTQIFDRSPCNWPLTTTSWTRRSYLSGLSSFYGSGAGTLASNNTFDISQPFTAYLLAAFPYGTNLNSGIFDACAGSGTRVFLYSPVRLNSAAVEFTYTAYSAVFGPNIISVIANSNAGTTLAFNGFAATGTIGAGRLAGFTLGLAHGVVGRMTGHIAEALFFVGSHTTTQRQQMEGYLAWKWGVQGYLPSYAWRRQNRVIVPAMVPYQVPDLALWLDAMDDSTITLSGNSVTRWADKSGLRNDASGGVAPTRSSNGVVFDGTTTFLGTPYTADPSAETIFAVATWTGSTDGSYAILGTDTTAGRSFLVDQSGGSASIRWDNWGLGGYARTSGITSNVSVLTTGLFTGTRVQTSVNGGTLSATADVSFSGVGRTNIGAGVSSAYFNGTIHEVLVYSNVLQTFERQRVEGYLAWKWGLRLNLPAGHPMREFKP